MLRNLRLSPPGNLTRHQHFDRDSGMALPVVLIHRCHIALGTAFLNSHSTSS